jgi:hypothetical protein
LGCGGRQVGGWCCEGVGGGGSRTVYGEGPRPGRVKAYEMVEGAEKVWVNNLEVLKARALMEMNPAEREAYKFAEEVASKQRQAVAQREFRGKREILAGEIDVALQNMKTEQGGIQDALAALLQKLREEALEQRDELLVLIR